MKFDRIIGVCDPKIIKQAEDKLSSCFTELSLSFDNRSLGSNLGGDALVFQLVYTMPHICDALAIQLNDLEKMSEEIEKKIKNGEPLTEEEKPLDADLKKFRQQMKGQVLTTCATSGTKLYYNPEFVNKLSKIGLRLVMIHEAYHSLFMHVQRRGSRLPRLFNIAVDYIVNKIAMEDLKARDIKDPAAVFTKELGEFITLDEYAAFIRDPFNPPPRLAHLNPTEALRKTADPNYNNPYSDVGPMYYADTNLSGDMKRPENVYDYLLSQIPKCPKCGRLGKYKKSEEYKQLQKKIDDQEKKQAEEEKKKQDKNQGPEHCKKDHKHDDGEGGCDHKGQSKPQPGGENGQPGKQGQADQGDGSCCEGGCSECGGNDSEYFNPFDCGDLLDSHLDSDISEDELQKKLHDAISLANKLGGKVPGSIEDELGILTAPTLSVWDFIRTRMQKIRQGGGRNSWIRPKTRPMFAGLYIPTKRTYNVSFLAAYDCSGSMSQEDIAFGISQLQVLDEHGEGYLLPWDSGSPYYESMVKIKKADANELKKAKVKGRGGTNCSEVFNTYEEHCGKLDIVVILTDGFLYDNELKNARQPPKGTETIWIITSHNPGFKPPWGRVFHLRGEKL